MSNSSQSTNIIFHLLSSGSITPLEALDSYGCFRLSARIKDLREIGWDIITTMITLPNGKRVARYSLTN